MLAHLAGERETIAVAGTHGKTSTSSMIATMLSRMGLAPTFLIGGEVDGFDTNAVNGSGEHYVVEADESDGSFIHLDPRIAVVTNVEADHLDHYGTLEAVEATFCEFMQRVPDDGDARHLRRRCPARRAREHHRPPHRHLRVRRDVRRSLPDARAARASATRFAVEVPGGARAESLTRVPGSHMVANATAALATAWVLGLDLAEAASRALGVHRRAPPLRSHRRGGRRDGGR